MSQASTLTIETFRGVNKKTTETLLQPGEASDMVNWMITDDMKLSKMYGYAHLFSSLGAHKINGMWYGALNGVNFLLFACNGHVYKSAGGVNTDIGAIADAYPTTFWVTNNTVYIMDGTDMYSWSGSGSIAALIGYAPTVTTAAPPSGGGSALEDINYLSGAKKMRFSPNGSAMTFQLLETSIAAVDKVVLNGVTKTAGTDYTVNLTTGNVIFPSAPVAGTNTLEITWTKVTAGDRALITNNRYFGGSFAARFWLFGNPSHKNTRYVSGVTMAGVSDPTYWPMYMDSDVGEYEISDIVSQYDKQVIFTAGNDSEAAAWYSYKETYTDSFTNKLVTIFPVEPINRKIGNVAKGQTRIIYNDPVTIWKGLYQWTATNVVNEKNAQYISENIQNDLDDVDLTKALTVDWADKGQYWLCVGKKCWVLNYRVKAWYILELAHTPTCFAIVDSKLHFGTTDGHIMEFNENLKTYDGATISAVWKMGYYNFGADWLRKFVQRIFVTIQPRTKTHVDISYQTDVLGASDVYTASYALNTFDHMNFAAFSFSTNYSPQPFKFKIRAKKIDYLKIVLTNDGTDSAAVLALTMPVRTGGEVKNR